ncbi:MAG TPA: dihydrofolate reductase family protein [Gammaproteobacteria bacterium]|nr:dihydrofolate reductase family protein [Gammaproteobacteria bacterium]
MRKLFVSNLISVDGYLAGPDGDLSWFAVGADFFAYVHKMMPTLGLLLFGRVTYEMMEQYWTRPEVERDDPTVARPMNELPKLVASRTLKKAGWGRWDNATVTADPVQAVRELKAQAGGDMVIFGSGGLVSTLAEAELIDEYRMIMNPFILGQGIPMFRGMKKRVPLKLVASDIFDKNVVMLTYHPETAR